MQDILNIIPKPSRYLGIEEASVHKDITSVDLHVALAFPDMYEIGMSYLGQKILYDLLNSRDNIYAERVFSPDKDTSLILKEHDESLSTLESDTPIIDTHLLGFSVTTELAFTNLLYMLDLSNIPLRQADRGDDLFTYPIVLAGGGCTICAEAIAPFMDLMLVGEAEIVLIELCNLLIQARKDKWTRSQFLLEARHIRGVYVPSLFEVNAQGELEPKLEDYTQVIRAVVADLNEAAYPSSQVIPFGAIHNRLSLEIARGCTRGCRFCQAGMTMRPSRERSLDNIKELLDSCLSKTGFEDISFLSLSSGDFSALKTLFLDVAERCASEQISLSLPSLRVGSVDPAIMEKMAGIRRTGATLAPEAGSQRLRDVINKGVDEEALIAHVRQLALHGWQQIKLYFMIGLPTETDEDLDGIIDLCKKVRHASLVVTGRKLNVTASVSPFVPKTHTPFQWEEQISLEEMQRRVYYLKERFKQVKGMTFRWHETKVSYLEGILSRSDRKLADLVELAYKKGATFCTWIEGFDLQYWIEAMQELGIDPKDYTGARDYEQKLPWDHLETGVSKEFLLKERHKADQAGISKDCRYNACLNCGVCDHKNSKSRLRVNPDEALISNKLNLEKRDQLEIDQIILEPRIEKQVQTKAEVPKLPANLVHKQVRYKIWHRKIGQSAYLSQLEIQSLLERSMRRAGLALTFSQGFHPLPLLSFGKAMPVGVASNAEWFAITLREQMSENELFNALNPYMLKGMELIRIEKLPLNGTIAENIKEEYLLTSNEPILFDKIKEYFVSSEYKVIRVNKNGEKEIDLRPFIEDCLFLNANNVKLFFDWSQAYLSPMNIIKLIMPELDQSKIKLLKLGE